MMPAPFDLDPDDPDLTPQVRDYLARAERLAREWGDVTLTIELGPRPGWLRRKWRQAIGR
jgi:hypothetical protein